MPNRDIEIVKCCNCHEPITEDIYYCEHCARPVCEGCQCPDENGVIYCPEHER